MRYFKILKSGTFWSFVALFLISGLEGLREYIPDLYVPIVSGMIAVIGIVFRVKQRNNFKDKR